MQLSRDVSPLIISERLVITEDVRDCTKIGFRFAVYRVSLPLQLFPIQTELGRHRQGANPRGLVLQ